jgi:hypothetical protein
MMFAICIDEQVGYIKGRERVNGIVIIDDG